MHGRFAPACIRLGSTVVHHRCLGLALLGNPAISGGISGFGEQRTQSSGKSVFESSGRPSSGVSIFCNPAMRWLVSLSRSNKASMVLSLTPICCFEKFVLAFQALDIGCRDRSRQVGACRCLLSRLVVAFFRGDSCRDWSRHVATCRDRSHLLDIGDVLVHRRRRDQIFLAERGFDAAAVEVAFGAIALHAAGRAGESGAGIALKASSIVRVKSLSGLVATGRDRSSVMGQ